MKDKKVLEILNSILQKVRIGDQIWLCFRLADEDDVEEVAVVLLKAYCGLYDVESSE